MFRIKAKNAAGVLAALIFAVLSALILCSCAGSDASASQRSRSSGDVRSTVGIDGTDYAVGEFNVTIPDGWIGCDVIDVLGEYDADRDLSKIMICKGGQSRPDPLSDPCVSISHFGRFSEVERSEKSRYEDAEDIKPLTLGDYTYEGFSCMSSGSPLTVLWGEKGDDRFEIIISTRGVISLDDEDVRGIISSIRVG